MNNLGAFWYFAETVKKRKNFIESIKKKIPIIMKLNIF